MDWKAWHTRYQTDTELQARLELVKASINEALLALPAGKITVLSLCSGDARDIIEVLPTHARCPDVSGWLLESNASLVHDAQQAILRHGLEASLFPCVADATDAKSYATIPPAHLLVLAGVFGSVDNDEIPRFLLNLQVLCAPSAYVIWTQNISTAEGQRRTAIIQQELGHQEFSPINIITTPQQRYHVGLHQYAGNHRSRELDDRLFTFGLQRYADNDG